MLGGDLHLLVSAPLRIYLLDDPFSSATTIYEHLHDYASPPQTDDRHLQRYTDGTPVTLPRATDGTSQDGEGGSNPVQVLTGGGFSSHNLKPRGDTPTAHGGRGRGTEIGASEGLDQQVQTKSNMFWAPRDTLLAPWTLTPLIPEYDKEEYQKIKNQVYHSTRPRHGLSLDVAHIIRVFNAALEEVFARVEPHTPTTCLLYTSPRPRD